MPSRSNLKTPFILISLCLLWALTACKRDESFPGIGSKVAGPIGIEKFVGSGSPSYFYVLNADLDRTYDTGSILVIDTDGEKVSTQKVQRMGRFLKVIQDVNGNDVLISAHGSPEPDVKSRINIFSLADPANPKKTVTVELNCTPNNIAAAEGYEHFVMNCSNNGAFYVGTLPSDLKDATLKHVRTYNWNRHAVYLDPQRELAFAFVTDIALQEFQDIIEIDVTGFDNDGKELKDDNGDKIPNEVPDSFENNRVVRSDPFSRKKYQFVMYDIASEREAGFPIRPSADEIVESEYRWVHFNVQNFDGSPDINLETTQKYYRTNFWAAHGDPDDPNSFYLSQRTPPTAKRRNANHVVKVRFIADPRVDEDGTVPKTAEFLTFERVYGFKGSQSSVLHYPGDLDVSYVDGQKLLFVNHFRDLDRWKSSEIYYSLAAQLLDGSLWFSELSNRGDAQKSWYQIKVLPDGTALSALFYGNAVMLLEVEPGVGIKELSRIE